MSRYFHSVLDVRSLLAVLFAFLMMTGSVVIFAQVAVDPVTAHEGPHNTPLGTPGLGATDPTDFSLENVVDGLVQPVALAFLPDGRLLVLQKGGEIAIADPADASLASQTYMTVTNLDTEGERGLAHIVVDPQFVQNGYFYVYYQAATPSESRVSRFQHVENSGGLSSRGDLSSETVIWTSDGPLTSCCHFGGGMDFGPDGLLYLSTGEQFDGTISQDLTKTGGKIHRFYSDGSVPADNPFVGNASIPDTVWAYGLRNPYRAAWDLPTHRFFIGDVGGNVASSREEINLGEAGANYAWPVCEGDCPGSQYTDPLYSYAHRERLGGAVTAGAVYRGNQYPSEYTGAFFFADYAYNEIRYLTFDDTGAVTGDYLFRNFAGRPVDLVVGPDGALYSPLIAYGDVRRVEYKFATDAPYITSASANVTEGPAPLAVEFTGFAEDPNNEALTYTWEFGDGTNATGATATHTYSSTGVYQARLRVVDASGNEDVSDPIDITVGSGPTVQIDSPTNGTTFVAGDTITYSGSATTVSGDPIPSQDLSWTVVFTHNDHTHPVLGPESGSGGSFDISRTGHDYHSDTGYLISLTATDTATGLSTTESVEIDPVKVDLTMESSPSGIDLSIDGIPDQTPYVYDTLVGFDHTISAPASQCVVGTNYEFDSWSDGGAQTHVFRVPTTDTTLTATYVANGSCTGGGDVPTNGLVAHYESTQGVTTSGSTVTAWADQSGNGNDLTTSGGPTLATSPTGAQVVRFDGVDDMASRTGGLTGAPTGNSDRTMFVVAEYREVGYGGVAYGFPKTNQALGLSVAPNGDLMVQGWGGANDYISTTAGTGAGWLTQSVVHENGAFTHYKDGTSIDSGTHTFATVNDRIVVGAEMTPAPYLDMDVAAVLIYDRALTETERQQVEDYLQQTYIEAPQTTASVSITSPTEGATITGTDLTVSWDATPATAGDHVHLTLDDEPHVGSLSLSGSYTFTGVSEGAHTVTAQVASSGHVVYTNPEARDVVNVTLEAATTSSAPVANDDSASVAQGGSVTVDVLANDTDADGDIDPTTVQVTQFPASGTVVVDAVTGAIDYTHDGSTTTSDSFRYTVADSTGNVSNEATVSVSISTTPPPSGLPVTSGLALHLDSTTGVTTSGGTVTTWADQSGNGNDLTASGGPTVATNPAGAQVVRFDGVDDVASRTGGLTGVPTGSSDRTMFVVAEYREVGYGGVAYGEPKRNRAFGLSVDPNGDLMVQGWGGANDYISTTAGTGTGWLTQSVVYQAGAFTHYKDGVSIDTGTHTFATTADRIVVGAEMTPAPYLDMDVAAVIVYDRALTETERQQVEDYLQQTYLNVSTGTASVSITSPTEGATITGDSLMVSWDATAATAGDHVHLTLDGGAVVEDLPLTGTYTFTGVSEGSHTVTATVADSGHTEYTNTEASDAVSVTLEAATTSTAPVATDDSASVEQGGSVSVDVLSNDTDADGDIDPTTVQVTQFPALGTVVVDAVTGAIEYTHDGSATTSDSFRYTVADSTGNVSNEATVSVTIEAATTSSAPVANDDSASVTQGGSVTVDVLANDTDADSDIDPTTVQVTQFPASGSVVVDAVTGAIDYTHDGSTTTSDSFRYTVADSTGNVSNEATVSVSISTTPPPSDLPVTNGLALHLDSTAGVTTSGSTVTTWADQSGNGNDLSTSGGPTLATSPTGAQVVRFDGVDDVASRTGGLTAVPTGASDRTMFVVAEYREVGYGGVAYGSPDTNQAFGLSVAPNGDLMVQGWGGANDYISTTAGTGTGWFTQSVVYEAGAFTHYKDGAPIDSATHSFATTADEIVVGAEMTPAPYLDMDVAAVVVYDRALSETERQQVEDHLQQTYLGSGSSGTASVSITSPTEGAIITGDSLTVSWDATAATAGDHVHLSLDGGPVVEDLSLSGSHTFTGVSEGAHTVTATVADSGHTEYTNPEATDSVSVTLEAATTSTAPVANGDSASVSNGGSVTVDVLANDTDADGDIDPSTVQVTQFPASGSVVVDAVTGAIDYTHDGSTTTSDSFSYTVADSTGNVSNEATVSVSISTTPPPSGLPVTSGLALHLDSEAGVTTSGNTVTAWADQSGNGNDLTASGGPTLETNPAGAQVVRFDGVDDVASRTGGLTAVPTGASDRTMFVVAEYREVGYGGVAYGRPKTNQAFGLSVDPNGDLMVQGWGGANDYISTTAGTGTGWFTQSVVYQAGAFTHYKDGVSIDSGTHTFATVNDRIVVGAEMTPAPYLDMDVAAVIIYDRALSETERQQVEDSLQQTYLDTPSGTASVSITDPADGATITGSNLTVSWDATPATAGDHVHLSLDGGAVVEDLPLTGLYTFTGVSEGSHTVTATVADSGHLEYTNSEAADAVTVTLEAPVLNTAPVTSGDTATVTQGENVTVDVLANDADSDGTLAPASVTVMSTPASGQVAVDAVTGAIEYTHDGSTTTSDSFTYTVDDDTGATSNETTVSVTVEPAATSSAPVASDDSATVTNGGNVTMDVLANDADADGDIDSSTVQVTQSPASGTVIVDAVTGAIEYTHDGSATTSDSFAYTVADSTGNVSNEATVTVTIDAAPTSAPVASDDSITVTQSASVTVDVLANDADADGDIDPTTVQVTQSPASGSVVVDAVTGTIEYTHDGSATTSDSFTYTVADSTGNVSNEATVSVTVDAVATSSAPVAADDSAAVTQGQSVTVDVLANDADADGDIDPSTVQVTQLPTTGTVIVDAVTGAIEYTHDGSATTSDSFSYTVADSTGNLSNEATVSVAIDAVPTTSAPVASDDSITVTQGESVTVDVLANDVDADGDLDPTTVQVTQSPSSGTTTVDAVTGVLEYTHDGSATTSDSFSYTVTDSTGNVSNEATVTVTIDPAATSSAPVATDDSATVTQGESVTTDVLANDADADGDIDSTTVQVTQLPTAGSVVVDAATGAIEYTHDGSATTSDSFSYTVADATGNVSNEATVSVTIEPAATSSAPVAADDSATVTQSQSVTVDVLANDTDADGDIDPSTVQVAQSPASGSVIVDAVTGAIEYTHDGSATTSDSFSYTVADATGNVSNEATVSITIEPVPTTSAPVATDDSATVTEGNSVSVDVLTNDVDSDGDLDPTTVQVTQSPTSGSVVVDAVTGTIEYTHDGSATTSDSFTYTVADATGNVSNEATVSVTVDVTTSAPVAADDTATVTQGESVSVDVLANDVDADGDIDPATVQVTQTPASGSLVVDAVTGAIEYTHDGSATTSDSFTYTVADSTGNVSNEATVSITVDAAPTSAPVANDDSATVTEGDSISVDVLANDADADGDLDSSTVQVTQSPTSGTVVVDAATGAIEYTHDGSATTSDSFSYTVADATGNVSNEATVSVTIDPAPTSAPVATDDSTTVVAGNSVSVAVLANDADVDGDIDPATVQVTQSPASGSVVVDAVTGAIEYTHDGSATTSDSFSYTVADATGNTSNEATVSVTVDAAPTSAPVANDDSAPAANGGTVTVDVLANDVDADGDIDPTTVLVTQSPVSGTTTVDPATGAIEYTHDGSATTSDSFTYTVADSTGNTSNEATVSVTVDAAPTSAPVANDDSATVTEGSSVTIDVLSNDVDAEGDLDPTTVQVTQSPVSGTVIVDAVSGAIEYTHDGSATTSDSFTYTVADSTGNVSNEATVSVSIEAVPTSAPVATDDSASVVQGANVTIDVLTNDVDSDGDIDPTTVQVTQSPASGTVIVDAVTGAIEYTHDGSATTSDSFAYTVADSTGNVSNEATVSVTVELTSSAPVATDDSATVTQGESVSIDVLANDADADGDLDSTTVQATQSPASGSLVVDAATGAVEYTHDGSATTSDTFAYTVADSTGNVSNEATVSVTIEPAPTSAPVASDDSASVTQGESVTVDVLANDADADGDLDSTSVVVVQSPSAATTTVDPATGAIEYTHDGSATTSDSFSYTVADSTGNVSNEATVSVTIESAPTSAPVATDDSTTVTESESVTIDVLANDADADGDLDASTVAVVQSPGTGSVVVDGVTGTIEYTHDGSAATSDSFTYTVEDATGNVSNEATVSVTIEPAPTSAPVASDDSASVTQGESVSIDVLANDADADGDIDPTTVQVTQSPTSGTAVVDATTGAVEYTHDGSATTSDTFAYTVADSTGNVSNEATVSLIIELASSAPAAVDDSATVTQGESVSIDVLANDADADGDLDASTVQVTQAPTSGAIVVDPTTGAIEYTHDGSATTSDSFVYTVADSTGNVSNEATVSVTIEAAPTSAPVASDDSATVTQGESVSVDILANDADADGDIDPTTVQVTQSPASGSVIVDATTGAVEYTHDGSATTGDSFSYTVADSTGNVSNEATVSVTVEAPVTSAPVTTDDSASVTQGESVSIDVLTNDADADGDIDSSTVQVTQSPASGSVVVDAVTGTIEYTHDGSATTSDSFAYTVADSTGNVSNEATVSVTVEPASSAPVATNDSATVTAGGNVSIDVLANDIDVDGDIDPATVVVVQSPGAGSVVVNAVTGAIEYTHDGSATTSDSFTYTVEDSTGNVSGEATVAVTVE